MAEKIIAGWTLVGCGVLLLMWQVTRDAPWQAGVALGVVLLLVGGILVVDNSPAGREDE